MSLELVIRTIFSTFFLASVLRICTPIILPAMGGLFATSAGTFNMALEGIMLMGSLYRSFCFALFRKCMGRSSCRPDRRYSDFHDPGCIPY